MSKTFFLETFGCQMNVLDSQLVAGQLQDLGYVPTARPRHADLILFNTCSVRQHAEDKVLSRLGHLKALKRQRPDAIIGVIGCMAEREKDALFEKVPHVDLLCGPAELWRLPELIAQVQQRREPAAALLNSLSRREHVETRSRADDPLEALDQSRRLSAGESALQAYVRVQRGCDKFCTYCVVPFTRGPERSRPPAQLLAEARQLVAQGCREITLLGQTVNSYVYTADGRTTRFARLLEQFQSLDGLARIRFVTSFPADWDDDIFRVMRDSPKICRYLHIPAQSGSDRMLAAMRRTYTVESYLRLMDRAREIVPDIALASDFIVGFSSETEADFQQTVALVQRVAYKNIFVFKYSERPGTAAERRLPDDVPYAVKQRRNNELLAVQAEIGLRQKQQLVGHSVEVLVEGYSKAARKLRERAARAEGQGGNGGGARRLPQAHQGKRLALPIRGAHDTAALESPVGADVAGESAECGIQATENQLTGRTSQDMITVFDGPPDLIGTLVQVRVTSVSPLTLFGEVDGAFSTAP